MAKVNDRVVQFLARHAAEFRGGAVERNISEAQLRENRKAHIAERKRVTEFEVIQLELDGMTATEIQFAFRGRARFTGELPLCMVEVNVGGETIWISVFDDE